jgi:hypothetical protein
MLCSEDHVVRTKATTRAGKLLERFLHGYLRGTEPLLAHLAGYIPVLLEGPYIHLPARRLEHHVEGFKITARYAMERRLLRGARVAFHLARSLVLKNVIPGYREKPLSRRKESAVELVRKTTLDSKGLTLDDRIEGPLKGKQLVIGVRRFAEARASVEGLPPMASLNAWGSDGSSTLDLYGMRCGQGEVEYRITLSG